MVRRTIDLPGLIATVMILACAAALLAVPREAEAAFPGENGGIVFQGFRGWDDPGSLYSRDPDSGEFTQLTNNTDNTDPLIRDQYPAVSPDGTRVVFVRTADYYFDDLYVANTRGKGGAANLTDDPAMAEFGPTWSPGGQKVAFAAYPTDQYGNREGSWEVHVIDADGSDRTKITDNALDENHLAWSPDGTKIAFSAGGGNGGPGVYVMEVDGSDALKVADGDFPSWSPDGRKLAYSAQGSIYTIDANGSDRREIVTDRFEDDPDIQSVYDSDPAWSPDGTKIAFARAVDFEGAQGNGVYAMNLDGSDLKIVAGNFPRALDPDWGPAPPPDAKPTITGPRPAPGDEIRDRTPTLRATVRDETDELGSPDIGLYVDGTEKAFAYDAGTGRLTRTTGRLSYGRHSVRVVAEDGAGNVAERTWSFRVIRRR